VKGGHSVFGECPQAARLLVVHLHGILSALHRSGRLHQQGTMFPSDASGSAIGYDSVLRHSLMFFIKTLLVSMIYMMFPLLINIIHMMLFLFIWNKKYVDVIMIMLMMFLFFFSNKHLITIVMIMIMSFCWIKLNLKLPIFLTIQKRYIRQFSSVGFAGLLKPTPFEGTHYKRWR
jgi:hypothetical protein